MSSLQDNYSGKPDEELDQYGSSTGKYGEGADTPKRGDDKLGHGHNVVASLQHLGSPSSSSSSSEDDGEGGSTRVKASIMKEKIKEKLPNKAYKGEQTRATAGTAPTPAGDEKKPGTMDKIKEKLPGGKH